MSQVILMSKVSLVPQVILGAVTAVLLVVAVTVTLEGTLVIAGIMIVAAAFVALLWSGLQRLDLKIDEDAQQLEVSFRHHLLARTVRFAQVKALRLESPRRAAIGYGLRYDLGGSEWFINSDAKQFLCFDLERKQKLYVQCSDALELDGLILRLERVVGIT